MPFQVLILISAAPFATALKDALTRAFPDLTVHVAANAVAAMPFIAATQGMLTIGSALTDELLQSAERLVWIQSLGTGTDGIVDRPSLRRDVVVTNARGLFDDAVSECGIALMLGLARNLPRLFQNQAARRWDFWTPVLLAGKSVGIIGLGAIGTTLARKCKALGMRVVGISNRREAPDCDQITSYHQLVDTVRDLDFVVLVAALTPQTRGLIDRRVLAAMRSSSYLINLGRGAMVVEADLIAALRSGTIAGAALDAFVQEPLPEDSELWSAPNVIISPHLAGPHDSHLEHVIKIIEQNIRALRDGAPDSVVNVVQR
ncbi:D-2-hydroxyacid dehydrogenase [Peristeroidobacter soli]|jgi:phosphoglycerate dehydrogenase-like enzyme|uniref:D-2-hydroxyacid dehydrogenase n=1 Tax=Peristeroidobacter soli TaxID=2497877 RepID=UPI00101DF1FB|nr:D-2-hydroxyacid dehydrogenase [Peristeroidobacter soli]